MKEITMLLIAFLPSILSVSAAGFMVMNDKSGWGWFLFVACLLSVSKFKSD